MIEIKGFENMPLPVEYLAQGIGKYRLYLSVLNYLKINHPLYMAVSEAAYHGILSEAIGQQTLQLCPYYIEGFTMMRGFIPSRYEIVVFSFFYPC